jgi:hypothetical protein
LTSGTVTVRAILLVLPDIREQYILSPNPGYFLKIRFDSLVFHVKRTIYCKS